MRTAHRLCLALVLCVGVARAVEVQRTPDSLSLNTPSARLSLATRAAAGSVELLALSPGDEPLLRRAEMSLYFKQDEHWVAEAWTPPSDIAVDRQGPRTAVAVEVASFGGFALRKTLTVQDDSPVITVAYELRALGPVRPELICPLGLLCDAGLDTVRTPGGAVAAQDVRVGDFSIELAAPWYWLGRSDGDAGVAVAPLQWPDMHRVDYIGRKQDGALSLACRLHPLRTFQAGDVVRFSYALVPYRGDWEQAVRSAKAAAEAVAEATDEGLKDPLPVAYCAPLQEPPTIDGRLQEPCWASLTPLAPFMALDGVATPEAETSAHVARQSDALLIAVRCREPRMDLLRADAAPESADVWRDDCVEIFVNPTSTPGAYRHLIVNAAGVTQDNLPPERGVAYEWQAAAARDSDGWTVEARIPFSDLDAAAPQDADAWRLNICRSRLPRSEQSAWSPTLKPSDFHVPDRFGLLVFGAPTVRVTAIDTGLQGSGDSRSLYARVENRGARAAGLSGWLTVARTGDDPVRIPLEFAVPAGEAALVRAPYQTPAPGAYELTPELAVVETAETVLQATFAGQVHSTGLCSAIYPPEMDDNRLYIARDTTQHFFFVPANHGKTACESFSFVLELPAGLEVIQATGDAIEYYHRPSLISQEAFPRDGRPMVRWVFEATRGLSPRNLESVRFFNSWCGALRATDAISDGEHPFYFYLQSPEEQEPAHEGRLIVLPTPRGSPPRRIVIAMSNWTISPTPEFWRDLLATYRRCGINAVDCHIVARDDDRAQEARQAKMRCTNGLWWHWWDEAYLKDHPEHAAVAADGSSDGKSVCPEVLADPASDAISGVMSGILASTAAGRIQGSWWDLEGPACFDKCFCPRCLARFGQEAGIAGEEGLTAARIQARYPEQWVTFACGQSARIARRMKQYAAAAKVPWELSVYSGARSEHTRRAYRVDWDTLAPEIDVATPSFYSFSAAALATNFTDGVTDCVRAIRAVADIPVWCTLTTGYDRGDQFVSDGRVTRMQVLKSVAFGADGTLQWWWGPVDGRHYQAYAEATSIVSELEAFFVDGRRVEDIWTSSAEPPVSRVAWRLGDETLLLLFNDGASEPVRASLRLPAGLRLLRGRPGLEPTVAEDTLSVAIPALDCAWVVLAN